MKIRLAAALLFALLFALPCAAEEFYREMPELLRFTQTTVTKTDAALTYPDTASDTVDAAVRASIDALAQESRENLASGAEIDAGAVISRSGKSLLSFLVLAETTKDRELLSVRFEAMAFDTATGAQVRLGELFEDGAAYELLSGEMRRTLEGAFPALEPDQTALDALCAKEALQEAAFTLGGAKLTLTYRADSVYPGRSNTLLHVTLYYPDIRQHMTERAFVQTDNSRFVMVALTYDDGGGGKYTRRLLGEMRSHGVTATFFLVGRQLRRNHDNLVRQQNSGYSLQYHSYTHPYGHKVHYDQAFEEKAMFEAELSAITGVVPTLMRAPGGKEEKYMRWEIGYPLIHWSLSSTDSGNPHVDAIASRVIRYAWDGDIVLMHDINDQVNKYSKKIFENFNSCGMMTVTVEELFAHAGIALEKNKTYYSTKPDQEEE